MRERLAQVVETIRTGFWFIPMLMVAAAAGLSLLLLHVDRRLDPGLEASLGWAYSGGPAGARSLLSTVAGSMITAASVTFSLASVALSIASQQYGSRVLRNFLRDTVTQVMLGTFVSTFVYSVLVVRTIRGTDFAGGFVPAVSITVAIVLALASLLLLIYFVHHISTSIQASRILRVIADATAKAIPKLYPKRAGKPLAEAEARLSALRLQVTTVIASERSGYLQRVDTDRLMELATCRDLVLEVLAVPGDHLLKGEPLARVLADGPAAADREALRAKVAAAFQLDKERTPAQDIRYHFQQLTEVIVRALSPGINDPFTAVNGIDELATGVQSLAAQGERNALRQDREGHLRLVLNVPTLHAILDATVGHIAIYAANDRFVMSRLRRVLQVARNGADASLLVKIACLGADLDRREAATAEA